MKIRQMKTREVLTGIGAILVGLLLIIVGSSNNSAVWLIFLGGGLIGAGIGRLLHKW